MARLGTVGLVLAVGLLIGPAGGGEGGDKERWKKFIPDDVFKTLVEREIKIVQKNLEGNPDKDQLSRARGGASMIVALVATHEKPGPPAVTHGRTAQAIAAAIRQGKLDQARKLVDDIIQDKNEAKGEKAKPDWTGNASLADIMDPLRTLAKGGDGIAPELQVNLKLKGALNGIEEKIRNLGMKELTKTNMEKASKELVLLSYRLAALAEMVPEYPLPKKTKGTVKGTAKEWLELSLEMRNSALELAAAARKKDTEAVKTIGARLYGSCSACHSTFR